jgi:hypothetical protein
MENKTRLFSDSDRFDTRDIRPVLTELRRKAWETLLDLGLTDEEIAAYYETAGDPARHGVFSDERKTA